MPDPDQYAEPIRRLAKIVECYETTMEGTRDSEIIANLKFSAGPLPLNDELKQEIERDSEYKALWKELRALEKEDHRTPLIPVSYNAAESKKDTSLEDIYTSWKGPNFIENMHYIIGCSRRAHQKKL